MEVIFYLTLLLLANFSRGNDDVRREEESDIENDKVENDAEAFESFGSPVYGLNSVLRGPGGKSAYNAPVPALASSYGAYVASIGLGNPYAYGPYSRYGFMPYANPYSYGYGNSLFNNPAVNSPLLAGYGYAGYGGPYFGRSVMPGYGYGYPGYNAGLGYRFGGLGYPPAGVRGPAAVPGVPAPVAGVPAPAARVPAPVAAFPPPVPNAFPAPVPAALPPRPVLRPIQNKDGTVRYGYVPADLPAVY